MLTFPMYHWNVFFLMLTIPVLTCVVSQRSVVCLERCLWFSRHSIFCCRRLFEFCKVEKCVLTNKRGFGAIGIICTKRVAPSSVTFLEQLIPTPSYPHPTATPSPTVFRDRFSSSNSESVPFTRCSPVPSPAPQTLDPLAKSSTAPFPNSEGILTPSPSSVLLFLPTPAQSIEVTEEPESTPEPELFGTPVPNPASPYSSLNQAPIPLLIFLFTYPIDEAMKPSSNPTLKPPKTGDIKSIRTAVNEALTGETTDSFIYKKVDISSR